MSVDMSRITGLASGMDIEGMIKQLMDAERIPLNKMEQQKQLLEWQRDKYRDMNTKILEFRNIAFDMRLQSKYLARTASSENDAAVSVSAGSSAIEGIYTIKVDQLAKAAQLTSGSTVGAEGLSSTLESIGFEESTSLTIRGDKGTAQIDVSGEDTIATLINKINNHALRTGVRASYDETLDHFFFVSSVTGKDSTIDLISENSDLLTNVFKFDADPASKTASTVTANAAFGTEQLYGAAKFDGKDSRIDDSLSTSQTIRISRNGQNYDFTITSSTTVQDLIDRINVSGLKEQGVSATFTSDGKLSIFNPSMDESITFTNLSAGSSGDDNVLVTLGLKKANGDDAFTVEAGNAESTIINGSLTAKQQLRITYNGEDYDFAIDAGTTLRSLMTNINTSGLGKEGVTAYMKDGKLAFFNPDDTKELKFENSLPPQAGNQDEDILQTLGFKSAAGADTTTSRTGISYNQVVDEGQNAEVWFNGVAGSYKNNTFSINGISFTVKKETEELTVSVANDVDAVYNNIKSFVDKYNEMIDLINQTLTESKYRDYTPLTQAQKEEMEEKEIELWEERAKSGILRSDSILSNAMTNFRTALYSQVQGMGQGALSQLFDIGISTGSFSEQGKLYIDEAKLRQAIAERPDEVAALFTADDGNSSSTAADGIAVRMLNYSESVLARLKEKAGTSTTLDTNTDIGRKLNDLEERMRLFTDRLSAIEERYYNQFTALEKYINQMNQQSMYITQNFG